MYLLIQLMHESLSPRVAKIIIVQVNTYISYIIRPITLLTPFNFLIVHSAWQQAFFAEKYRPIVAIYDQVGHIFYKLAIILQAAPMQLTVY